MSGNTARPPGEGWFALLLLIFSVTAFWRSYAISGFTGLSTAGIFPMLASATMVCAAVFILARAVAYPPANTAANTQGFRAAILPLRLVVLIALISAYVIAMPVLGFLLASGLFLFITFLYLWRKSVLVSAALAVFTLICVYLVFRKLFRVVLPEGTLLRNWF